MTTRKLSQIAPSLSVPAATDQVVGVTGGAVDNLYTMTQLAHAVGSLIQATGNLDFYVSTTGSDSNPGTISQPFATIQHGVNVAAQFDYQNLYQPAVHLAAGTYNPATIVRLPEVYRVMGDGTSLLIGDAGYAVTTVFRPAGDIVFFARGDFSIWSIHEITADCSGIQFLAQDNAEIDFGFTNIGLADSAAGGNATFLGSSLGAQIAIAVATINILTPSFQIFFRNESFSGTPARASLSIILSTINFQPNTTMGFAFIATTNGDRDATYFFGSNTFTNTGTLIGPQAILINAGAPVSVSTDNAAFSDLPGSVAATFDNEVSMSPSGFGVGTASGIMVRSKAGLPTTADLTASSWGVFKDTSGGGVYVAYNDAGTIKKVALT